MRFGTSFFNSALYRKTMGRFWPLWTLYGLFWLFLLPLNLVNQYLSGQRWDYGDGAGEMLLDTALSIPSGLQSGVFLACVFGLFSAMAVFGYLYNSRSACAMHALPLRREGLFVSQYLAGLSFSLLPHLVVALVTAAVEMVVIDAADWPQALSALGIWFLVQSGTSLFFFSFAAFCAMFTGNVLALPPFYAILNGLCWGIYALISTLLSQFFYGYSYSGSFFLVDCLTPLYNLSQACAWISNWDGVADATETWMLNSPGTVAGYAAAGLVLALLALLVYRRRQVESAGDVVSVPLVRPIFQWGVTFCVGLALGMATALFFSWMSNALILSVCIVLWAVIGFFAAEMLLKKSFRVLRAWKRGMLAMVVMTLLCAGCFTDVLGIETRVPKADQVSSLMVILDMGSPYDDGRQLALPEITDPQQIATFLRLHQAVVDDRARAEYDSGSYDPGDNYFSLTLTYTLEGGSHLNRKYYSVPIFQDEAEVEGSVTNLYCQLLSDRALVAEAYGLDRHEKGRLVEAYLSTVRLLEENAALPSYDQDGDPQIQDFYYLSDATPQQLEQLWQAVCADFEAGTIGLRYPFNDQARWDNTYLTDLSFTFEMPNPPEAAESTYSSDFTISLTPNAQNTLAWLRQYGGLDTQYQLLCHDNSTQAFPSTQTQSSVLSETGTATQILTNQGEN